MGGLDVLITHKLCKQESLFAIVRVMNDDAVQVRNFKKKGGFAYNDGSHEQSYVRVGIIWYIQHGAFHTNNLVNTDISLGH